jgi:hypothetical protein
MNKKHLTEIVKDQLISENNILVKNYSEDFIEEKLNALLNTKLEAIQYPFDSI